MPDIRTSRELVVLVRSSDTMLRRRPESNYNAYCPDGSPSMSWAANAVSPEVFTRCLQPVFALPSAGRCLYDQIRLVMPQASRR
jgi:hypothetical protein